MAEQMQPEAGSSTGGPSQLPSGPSESGDPVTTELASASPATSAAPRKKQKFSRARTACLPVCPFRDSKSIRTDEATVPVQEEQMRLLSARSMSELRRLGYPMRLADGRRSVLPREGPAIKRRRGDCCGARDGRSVFRCNGPDASGRRVSRLATKVAFGHFTTRSSITLHRSISASYDVLFIYDSTLRPTQDRFLASFGRYVSIYIRYPFILRSCPRPVLRRSRGIVRPTWRRGRSGAIHVGNE